VPKRLALLAPEAIATLIARPMMLVARITHPLVVILSSSCSGILRLLGTKEKIEAPVTDDEIKVLMEQGAEAGVFHESEQQIVSNVLRLDEQHIASIMTPRRDMVWLDLDDDEDALRHDVTSTPFSRLVVCRGGLENVLGILQTGELLKHAVTGKMISKHDIEAVLHPPLYMPETASTTRLLESFRSAKFQYALLVDEFGDVQGLVTLTDVLSAIVGDISSPATPADHDMVQREDGSWLVDGNVSIERLKSQLGIDDDFPGEAEQSYHTLGGLIMHILGRVPAPSDHGLAAGCRFEVMDMDRNRVDKVLVTLPQIEE
jgi:putative hemolysin